MTAAAASVGWLIGRFNGIPIYLGRSWPLIAVVVVVSFAPTLDFLPRPLAYAVACAYAILLLLSVLAHEAGHAVVARRVGARVEHIVADLWGGHTVFETEDLKPGSAVLVAVSGPAANLGVAGVAWVLNHAVTAQVPELLLWAAFVTNVLVAVFNLLPGLPLDGGFVVDAVVWKVTGDRATGLLVAGWLGRVVTLLVALWFIGEPFLSGRTPSVVTMVWVGLLGGFLWVGASQAIRMGQDRRSIQAVRVARVLRPVAVVAGHGSGRSVLRALDLEPEAHHAVLVGPDGKPLGFIDTNALSSVPSERLHLVPAVSLLVRPPEGWVVRAEPDDDAFAVVQAFSTLGSVVGPGSTVLVVDATGQPIGTVAIHDLNDALLGS